MKTLTWLIHVSLLSHILVREVADPRRSSRGDIRGRKIETFREVTSSARVFLQMQRRSFWPRFAPCRNRRPGA